jgi:membrane protein YqaA with SNARE-associated domain
VAVLLEQVSMNLVVLFLVSLLAATIFPAQSEALLAALHLQGHYAPGVLIAVATSGNVLGSCINWLLGRFITHFRDRRWFPVKEKALRKAEATYLRYGVWSLLFAWVPVLGDPLTVIAGALRTPFIPFLILVTAGKLARYVVLVMLL